MKNVPLLSLRGLDLFSESMLNGRCKSKSEISQRTGLSYPTVLDLTKNHISNQWLKVLSHYLFEGLHLSADDVMQMQIKDLFDVQ